LNGKYTDFNTDWYLITGDIIIQTMIINIFTPGIIIFVNYVKFKVQIWWDQRLSKEEEEEKKKDEVKFHTKKTSI